MPKKDNKSSLYEEIYPQIGYKTTEGALEDFEKFFGQELKLPLRVPPISFTHHFGWFNNMKFEDDEHFEVTFIIDQKSENHYKIVVWPINNKIPIKEENVLNTFKLKNNTVATYIEVLGFNSLVFEKDDWQYTLYIDKRVSNIVTPEVLVQIANSIDYPVEIE